MDGESPVASHEPLQATATSVSLSFRFSQEEVKRLDVNLKDRTWTETLKVLGLESAKREFFAGRLDPAQLRLHVRVFLKTLDEYAEGNKHAHLRQVQRNYPDFNAWVGELRKAVDSAGQPAEGLRKQVQAELLAYATKEAGKRYSNDDQIDYSEWDSLLKDVRSFGFGDDEAAALSLEACRAASRDPNWRPPEAPENDTERRKTEEAKALQLAEERKLEEAKALQSAEERKLEEAKALQSAEERKLEEAKALQSAEERKLQEALKAQTEASRDQKAEERRREEAIKEQRASEAKASQAELERQKLRAKEDADAREANAAAAKGAIQGLFLGAILGAGLALVSGVFSATAAVRLGETREPLTVAHSPEAVQAICKAAESPLEPQWETLKTEVLGTIKSVPRARERERLMGLWNAQCPRVSSAPAAAGGETKP